MTLIVLGAEDTGAIFCTAERLRPEGIELDDNGGVSLLSLAHAMTYKQQV